MLKSFRFSVERTFVALWGVKQTVNLSRYSKLLLPNASEKFCVTLCFSSVKFFWGIKGSQAEWCGRGTWNLLVHVNSQLVWLLSNGILKLPVEYIWVIKNTLSLSLTHTHTHTNTHNSLGSMVVLQVGKKIQCESYRSINEAPAKLSFAVWLEYRQIYIENKSCARGGMEILFECSTRYLTSKRSERVRDRLEHFLQATMYYFVYYINTLLTRRSRFN